MTPTEQWQQILKLARRVGGTETPDADTARLLAERVLALDSDLNTGATPHPFALTDQKQSA